jgi:hypothetical protein
MAESTVPVARDALAREPGKSVQASAGSTRSAVSSGTASAALPEALASSVIVCGAAGREVLAAERGGAASLSSAKPTHEISCQADAGWRGDYRGENGSPARAADASAASRAAVAGSPGGNGGCGMTVAFRLDRSPLKANARPHASRSYKTQPFRAPRTARPRHLRAQGA